MPDISWGERGCMHFIEDDMQSFLSDRSRRITGKIFVTSSWNGQFFTLHLDWKPNLSADHHDRRKFEQLFAPQCRSLEGWSPKGRQPARNFVGVNPSCRLASRALGLFRTWRWSGTAKIWSPLYCHPSRLPVRTKKNLESEKYQNGSCKIKENNFLYLFSLISLLCHNYYGA